MNKILVIDDEESVRVNLVELLEAEGFDPISAENGRAGVQLARQQLPDLILCDIMMPELDGYGVLDELRQAPATATTPFIFLTAKAERFDLRQGMNLGADDYLVKPFTRDELLKAISARLVKQAAFDQKLRTKLDELRNSIALALPHEFRTPLACIAGYSEILAEDSATLAPAQIQDLARSMTSASNRLQRLIMNFLLYAELEIAMRDPRYASALKDLGPSSVTSDVSAIVLQLADSEQRQSDLSLELDPAAVKIGANFLRVLVKEIVHNAFKFSKAGTPVGVTGRRDGATYLLSVRDHGRGMTVEQIRDVGAYLQFERKRHEQQGSGLGLIIAKRLAELHGGALTIESVYRQATTVHIALPVSGETH
jgi:DNA-binding response OmpR family regulator